MDNKSFFLFILINLTIHSLISMDSIATETKLTPDLNDQQLLVDVMFGRIKLDPDAQKALVGKILREKD
jgi:hypothetical protein